MARQHLFETCNFAPIVASDFFNATFPYLYFCTQNTHKIKVAIWNQNGCSEKEQQLNFGDNFFKHITTKNSVDVGVFMEFYIHPNRRCTGDMWNKKTSKLDVSRLFYKYN